MRNIKNISVIGDGGWGTTLAIYLCKKGYNVSLWGPFPDYLEKLKNERENIKFLPNIKIPPQINITFDKKQIVEEADLIIFAVPSKFMRSVLQRFSQEEFKDNIVMSVVKGIEEDTFMRMSEVIQDVLPDVKNVSVLSGPTIAHEVATEKPAACVIASSNKDNRKRLQKIFNSKRFRVYTNPDVVGVELCGAVKNIIAIAAGISEGLGYGTNTKAALLTRSAVEFSRLGKKLGAYPDTFSGLAGMGDLVTTCFSPRSRNRSFGEAIGKGKKKEEIISNMDMVVEGVTTVKAIYGMAEKFELDLPITRQVYEVLYEKKSSVEAVDSLMSRETKAEYRK